jgi:type I restriction enzyme S subunit
MSLLRIDEIFNFEKGVLQSSKCVPGEFDFITASSDWKTHNEYTHDCEALIFAAAASGSLGRTHYVNGKFISSDLCFIITPKDQEKLPVDLKFYHILFNELKDEIVRNTKAGTSKEAIGLGSFGKYQLPYFDIDTQIEIKNRFVNSELLKSDLSNELNHQVDLVKKLRQQLLQDAVQGKLVKQNKKDEPSSELLKKIKAEKETLRQAQGKKKAEKELPPIKPEEIPFEIPENWVWCRLGEIIQFVGGSQPAKGKFFFEDGPDLVRLVQIRDFRSDKFKTYIPKALATRMFNEDDIMIGRYGPPVFQILRGLSGSYNVALMKARPINNLMSKDFCFHLLSEKRIQDIIIRDSERTAGQTGIRKPLLDSIIFALPSLSEQNRIVQKLDELMQYCNELEASIKQSESQNEKLLQQVLREALRKEPVEA